MRRVGIVGAKRTAIGSFGGVFKDLNAVDLGVHALKAAIAHAGVSASEIEEVVTGIIYSAGLGGNVSRQVAIGSGCPVEVPAYSVNKLCGSGLRAVVSAAQAIALGDSEIVAAGGTESMSLAPYVIQSARWGVRMGDGKLIDTMLSDGLMDVFNGYHMGITAENLAEKHSISRGEQDEFAAASQNKCEKAQAAGAFTAEIVPISIPRKKQEPLVVAADEYPRKGVTAESLAALKSAFKPDGTVTAGNSSGVNDGAAFLILASEDAIKAKGLKVLAWIAGYGSAGVDPAYMGIGPVPASFKALKRAGWRLSDLDFVELNEAFAAQSLAVLKEFGVGGRIPAERVNPNGGAIALGHPVGASGARILVTLIHEMIARNGMKGLATLCVGGGQGISLLVER